MRKIALSLLFLLFLPIAYRAHASVFGQIHGVVHDSQHRPISGAKITVKAATSSFTRSATSGPDGGFYYLPCCCLRP